LPVPQETCSDPTASICFLQYLALQSVISLILGLAIWFMVVKKRGSTSAFLATFGVVVPLALVLPIQIVSILGIRNAVLILPSAASSALIVFRCFEGKQLPCLLFVVEISFAQKSFDFSSLRHVASLC
jgi:hypothetical protein